MFVIWLAFAFLGIGMIRSAVYPRWLGWINRILGIVGIVTGIMQTFAGRESTLNLFMILNVSTNVSTFVVSIWVARKVW